MAETIEHRIKDIVEAKIPIFSLEGIQNIEENSPIGETFPVHPDKKPHTILLGYFENRGTEYILGIRKWKAIERISEESIVRSAFDYGKSLNYEGMFVEGPFFEMQVHAVVDPLQNKTYYFLLPHLKYFSLDEEKI